MEPEGYNNRSTRLSNPKQKLKQAFQDITGQLQVRPMLYTLVCGMWYVVCGMWYVYHRPHKIYDTNTSAFILKSLKLNHSVIFRQYNKYVRIVQYTIVQYNTLQYIKLRYSIEAPN